jgi:hypothetical protein
VAEATREISGILLPDNQQPEKKGRGIGVLFIAGTAAIITSIPLFISAGRNNKKAKALSVSFKPEQTNQLRGYCMTTRFVPALALKVRL